MPPIASDRTTSAPIFNPADFPGFIPESGVDYRPIPDDDGRLTGTPGTVLAGYLVGDDGNVWTCKSNHGQVTTSWRKLTPTPSPKGYLSIAACLRRKVKAWRVNRLVLTVFVGPCPPGMDGCHKDDDRANNRLSNLEWDTRQHNVRQRDERGRQARGERSGRTKVNLADIDEIKRLRSQGMSYRAIGRRKGISGEQARKLCLGQSWKHLNDGEDHSMAAVSDGPAGR